MDKKKLGLVNKNKLELRKTVGSGTVKQSFSHGRVKSVAVEVKKVRTFSKNNKLKNEITNENKSLLSENQSIENRINNEVQENNKKIRAN